jgi:hypothetical protein
MNPTTKLTLIGTIDFPTGGIASWQVDDDDLDLSVSSLSPITKLFRESRDSISRVSVSLVLKSNSLQEGSTYTFSLLVSLNTGYNSSSAFEVITNTPPLPGGLSVTPVNGFEMNTTFKFVAYRWEDVELNLPLTYAFASYSPLTGYSVFRSRRQKTTASAKLAAGQVSADYTFGVRLHVYDSLDGRSTSVGQVRVRPQYNITNVELANSLSNVSSAALRAAVNVVAGVINAVDCDGAGNCTDLHRESCGSVSNMCGSCLEGFYGESEAANSMCFRHESDYELRRLDTTVPAVSCSSDSDCASELMEVCYTSSLVCGPMLKDCDARCSLHGTCHHVSLYYAEDDSARFLLSECRVTDSSCNVYCDCDSGFAGEACDLSVEAFESAQSVRHLLLQSYKILLASENPTPDVVTSWLEGLAGVAAHVGQLSEASKELLVSMCSSILDVAVTLSMSYEDVVQVERVLSLTLFGGASSSLDSALALLNKFGLFLVRDLQVGQNPTDVVRPLFRLTVFAVDGSNIAELSVGRSGLEIATDASSQVVTLPRRVGGEPYKVLLTESVASMQSDAKSKELFQSVPVSIFLDSPLCSEPDLCTLSVSLLNFEFGHHIANEEKSYYTSCIPDEQHVETYSCPSGINVTAQCNGTMNGVISSNCSVHIPTSICDGISDSEIDVKCKVLEFSAEATICQCIIPDVPSWQVQYMSLASSDLANASSTFTPTTPDEDTLGKSSSGVEVQSSVVLYVVVAFVLYMIVVFVRPSVGKDNSRVVSSVLVSSPQELLDDGLPHIFSGRPFLRRMLYELTLNHKWSCIFFKSFEDGSARLRALSIVTITSFSFLVNSAVHANMVHSEPNLEASRICLIVACILVLSAPLVVIMNYITVVVLCSSPDLTVPGPTVSDESLVTESRLVTSTFKELFATLDNAKEVLGKL